MAAQQSPYGRYVLIAGSASATRDPKLIEYAHSLVREVTTAVLRQGGGIVAFAGKEPVSTREDGNSSRLTFDWSVLETAMTAIREGKLPWPPGRLPVVVVLSEKAEGEIPDGRRSLWRELLESGLVRVESIQPGARSGAMIRDRQAQFGDILICLGGGTGVEHLADLYLSRHKSVIPLDLSLGAVREDGTGGAARLNREARANADTFLRLPPGLAAAGGALLAGIATRAGDATVQQVSAALLRVLAALDAPNAFYVRLLDRKASEFGAVESYFREVVDRVVEARGYRSVEMGRNRAEHAFMNVGIFEGLRRSDLAVVDITGHRPNCFIEMGYALGRAVPVIVMAQEGTLLPFDQAAIPCHFWNARIGTEENRKALMAFMDQNIDRPPV